MTGYRDVASAEEADKLFPRPWKVYMVDGDCWGIRAANGAFVVTTDGGGHPPDAFTAARIVAAVNVTVEAATTGK